MGFSSLLGDDLPAACTTIEEVGSTGVGALTITFLVFLVSTIIFLIKAGGNGEQRKYYYLATYICAFATISYLAMLSGQGWTAVAGCRQFFYARYADWLVTTPLIVILLGLVAGAPLDTIAGAVGSDVIYVVASFVGSVSVVTTVKWFWFFISIVGIAGVLSHFAVVFKRSAEAKSSEIAQLYGKIAWLSILVWIAYPVVWLFSEGFASFSVSLEVCAYALLDLFSKVIVCFMVLSANDVLGAGSAEATGSRQYV